MGYTRKNTSTNMLKSLNSHPSKKKSEILKKQYCEQCDIVYLQPLYTDK